MQIQGDQNMALSMQVLQLTQQVHLMMNMMNQNAKGTGFPNLPSPSGNQSPAQNTPPGSSSSSSSTFGRKPRKGGGSPGGGGSPPPSPSPSSNQGAASSHGSSVSSDPYRREKKTMRIKLYDQMKLPPLPADAAKCRSFRNEVFSIICKYAKNDESRVFKWISLCNTSEKGDEFNSSGDFPILDRIVGSKRLELAKSTKFAMEFQTFQERFQAVNKQPKGRMLLWHVFQKFRLDRDRGTALSQHHLLSLKMGGTDVKALEEFKQHYDYCYGALEATDLPSENSLKSLLFENLKNHPKMALAIDKYREARQGSNKRTSTWLYNKMIEAIEISQMDVNTTSVDKALTVGGQDSKIAGAQAEPKTKTKEKPEKTSKPDQKDKTKKEYKNEKSEKKDKPKAAKKAEQESQVDAAAAQKGKGKGKGSKGKSGDKPELTKEQKAKLPCMYFAHDSCHKGKDCEFLHDKNNLYKGPKPWSKASGSSSTAAGAATVSAAAMTLIPSAEAAVKNAKKLCRKVASARLPGLNLMARTVTAIMAAITCCTPIGQVEGPKVPAMVSDPCEMEFLLDSGAGRNLLSKDSMPDEWLPCVVDPPENLIFRTGGGERKSMKAIELQGQVSGLNTFYTLESCPHALNLGIQVNQHRRGLYGCRMNFRILSVPTVGRSEALLSRECQNPS